MFHYFWYRQTLSFGWLCHDFLSKISLSHTGEKFRRGTFLCCVAENFWFRRNLWRKGGVPGFPVKKFLSHSAEKIHRGTHSCFFTFGYRQSLCFRGLSHDFLSTFFCLTVPKIFVGHPFVLSLVSGIEKR